MTGRAAVRLRCGWVVLLLSMNLRAQTHLPPAYHTVAQSAGIPVDILYAVAATESLYTVKVSSANTASSELLSGPWPWSLNISRKSQRFPDRLSAYRALQQAVAEKHSVDVGVMQINWRWHHQRFESLWSALDPEHNLRVGAAILHEQYQRTHDWWQAVGAYHAPGRDPASRQRAEGYRQRVKTQWRALVGRTE